MTTLRSRCLLQFSVYVCVCMLQQSLVDRRTGSSVRLGRRIVMPFYFVYFYYYFYYVYTDIQGKIMMNGTKSQRLAGRLVAEMESHEFNTAAASTIPKQSECIYHFWVVRVVSLSMSARTYVCLCAFRFALSLCEFQTMTNSS